MYARYVLACLPKQGSWWWWWGGGGGAQDPEVCQWVAATAMTMGDWQRAVRALLPLTDERPLCTHLTAIVTGSAPAASPDAAPTSPYDHVRC
jgi:hypothetical protein